MTIYVCVVTSWYSIFFTLQQFKDETHICILNLLSTYAARDIFLFRELENCFLRR